MSEPDKKMVKEMTLKIAEIVLEQEDENVELLPIYDPVVPIAEILCRHLKVCNILFKLIIFQKKIINFISYLL